MGSGNIINIELIKLKLTSYRFEIISIYLK